MKYLKLAFSVMLTIMLFAFTNIALAINAPGDVPAQVDAPSQATALNAINVDSISIAIRTATNWIAGIIFIIAVLVILIGAFMYMTSGGDETKTGKARGWIVGGIIGVVVALLAFAVVNLIVSIVKGFTGIS